MKNLFIFLWRYHFFFLFLILEIVSFSLVVRNNYYQKASFLNSTNVMSGRILAVSQNVKEYFSLREANRALIEENARLHNSLKKSFIVTTATVYTKNDTLYKHQYQYISAKVINNSTNKRNNYMTLNKGANYGIKKDMAVLSPNGIVGVVKDVSANFCSVMMVLHSKTKISGKIKKNGYIGTVMWEGGSYRKGTMTDVPTHVELSVGDTIISSGYSSIFPEGIMIGTIKDFEIKSGDNFFTIGFRFSEDYNKLSYVYIVKNLMKEEQDKLGKDE